MKRKLLLPLLTLAALSSFGGSVASAASYSVRDRPTFDFVWCGRGC